MGRACQVEKPLARLEHECSRCDVYLLYSTLSFIMGIPGVEQKEAAHMRALALHDLILS